MDEPIYLVDPNLSPAEKAKACEQLEIDRYNWYEDYKRSSLKYQLQNATWELA